MKYFIVIVLACFLLIQSTYSLTTRWEKGKELEKQELILQQEIKILKRENLKLKDEINKLKQDDYIEVLAREELGYIKKDELSFFIIKQKEKKKGGAGF